MPADLNVRIVQVLKDGAWTNIRLSELHPEDNFKMFEPDGTPVGWQGENIFVAKGEPYEQDHVWGIMCDILPVELGIPIEPEEHIVVEVSQALAPVYINQEIKL